MLLETVQEEWIHPQHFSKDLWFDLKKKGKHRLFLIYI